VLASLLLILRRVWRGPNVLEHACEVTAIKPSAASRAMDEVLGLVLGRLAETLPRYLPRGTSIIVGLTQIA
jgi:hypothetical protein